MTYGLSAAQTMIVQHGISQNQEWSPYPMPEWPFELPKWVLDARIDWMEQYSNPPDVDVLHDGTAFDGEWLYEYDKGRKLYIAESEGRVKWHSHNDLLSEIDYETKFLEWGKKANGTPDYNVRIAETEKRWATSQSEGYGGRHFPITMKDGRKAVLRGPWHTKCPPGYQEITTYERELTPEEKFARCEGQFPLRHMQMVEIDGKYQDFPVFYTNWEEPMKLWSHWWKRHVESQKRWRRAPRYQLTGCFGLAITYELLAKIVARYQPHLRLAMVKRYKMEFLEVRQPGCAPKGMTIEGQDLSGD